MFLTCFRSCPQKKTQQGRASFYPWKCLWFILFTIPFLTGYSQANTAETTEKHKLDSAYLASHPERSDDITTFFEALIAKKEATKEDELVHRQGGIATTSASLSRTLKEETSETSSSSEDKASPKIQNKIKVGFLAPLSGPYGSIGKSLHRAAEMALFDHPLPQFELLPRDTKGTIEGAKIAAEEVLKEGAQFIVGPLLSEETKALLPLLEEKQISLMTFSNNKSLLGHPNVYLFGMILKQSLECFIPYLEKETPQALLIILSATKQSKGLERIIRGLLPPKVAAITKFAHVHLGDIDDRFIQMIDLYDALWIPEMRPETANFVERVRIKYSPHRLRIFGSLLWGYPPHIKTPFFRGSIICGADPLLQERFFDSYINKFSEAPEPISSLAYDAVSLLIENARKMHPPFEKNDLTSRQGFKGLNGLFHFDEKGLVKRQLTLFQIKENGMLQKIDI